MTEWRFTGCWMNFSKSFFVFLCLWASALSFSSLRAQAELPIRGPFIAMNTVQQDSIILYDLGGQTYRTLTLGTGWHTVWGFSPDGCRILYTLSRGTLPAKLYSANLDGSAARALVEYPQMPDDAWGVWEAQWSPDGRRIVFVMIREDAEKPLRHIAWIPPEGGPPNFYSVSGTEAAPQWSPDGRRLAYISYEERAAGIDIFSTAVPTVEPPPGQQPQPVINIEEADLWLVNADGSGKYAATGFLTGSVSQPRWSPDGALLSFVFSQSANNDMVWMIGAQPGAFPTQLSYQWTRVLDLTWLPDSTAIIASMRDFRSIAENRLWQIPLVGRADDSAGLYLENLPLSSADFPRFSPDGKWLAVRTAYEMALVHLETGAYTLLDKRTMGNTPAVWSPAGFQGEAGC